MTKAANKCSAGQEWLIEDGRPSSRKRWNRFGRRALVRGPDDDHIVVMHVVRWDDPAWTAVRV